MILPVNNILTNIQFSICILIACFISNKKWELDARICFEQHYKLSNRNNFKTIISILSKILTVIIHKGRIICFL